MVFFASREASGREMCSVFPHRCSRLLKDLYLGSEVVLLFEYARWSKAETALVALRAEKAGDRFFSTVS
jgi:hypothetical protein